MKNAVEKINGNAFAVTSIGVAVNTGDGNYKAYDPATKQIKTSRTVLPINDAFYEIQSPVVKEGDFVLVGNTYMQVVLAGDNNLGVVDVLTGEQKTIIKEVSPDGVKFATVVKSAIPENVITRLVKGELSTEEMLLISGDKSLDQILALNIVGQSAGALTPEDMALLLQSRK